MVLILLLVNFIYFILRKNLNNKCEHGLKYLTFLIKNFFKLCLISINGVSDMKGSISWCSHLTSVLIHTRIKNIPIFVRVLVNLIFLLQT